MKKNSGFTLIELLVVIAIIGILAAIVIASLSSARAKGADTAVKESLANIRAEGELFYSNNGGSYLPEGGIAIADPITCPIHNSNGGSMVEVDDLIGRAIAYATDKGGNGNSCYNSASAWAVAVTLKTDKNTSWCIDNAGHSKLVNKKASEAIDPYTGICN